MRTYFWVRILLGGFGLILLGICVGIGGIIEGRNDASASAEPESIDLARLEAGDAVTNPHVKLGPHVACYYSVIYSYRAPKGKKSTEVKDDTKLDYCFYPILSPSHPFSQELEKLEKAAGGKIEDLDPEELPPVEKFTVLVKTTRFKKFSELPDEPFRRENAVSGLVRSGKYKLDSQEKKLIEEEFPGIDWNKVLVIEEGKKPTSALMATLISLGGVLLCVAGIGVAVFSVFMMVRR